MLLKLTAEFQNNSQIIVRNLIDSYYSITNRINRNQKEISFYVKFNFFISVERQSTPDSLIELLRKFKDRLERLRSLINALER